MAGRLSTYCERCSDMRIAIIGASGLIGTKVVDLLREGGHDVVAASRASGADVITGDGLGDALAGANVLVDVTNSPSFEDDPVMAVLHDVHHQPGGRRRRPRVWATTSRCRSWASTACRRAVMRAKVAQEKLITESSLRYSIVRATQFAEFADAIIGLGDRGGRACGCPMR